MCTVYCVYGRSGYQYAVYTLFCEPKGLAIVGKTFVVEGDAFYRAVDLLHDLSRYVLFVHSAVFVAEPGAVDTAELFEESRFAAAARAQKQQFVPPLVVVFGRIELALHLPVHLVVG